MDLSRLHRLMRGAAQSGDAAKALGVGDGQLSTAERKAIAAMRQHAKNAGGSLKGMLLAADPGEWVTPPGARTDRLKA